MKNTDLISVIVPVYNTEGYIVRCAESIMKQTYSNLEILLIDDGSTDSSGIICDKLAEQDARISVLHKKNGGLSDARNTGLDVSTGAYIAFVDSDDWLDPDMIQLLYDVLKRNDADIAECSYRNIYDDHVIEETNCSARIVNADSISAIEGMLDWKYFKPIVTNKLYKSFVVQDIRYPVGRLHEDEFTTYKYYFKAKKIAYVDVSKYNYDRTRDDSITGRKFSEANLDACWAFRERVDFFYENDIVRLQRKVNDAYCLVVLDRLEKCRKYAIRGSKVVQLLEQMKEDIIFFERKDVDPVYIKRFKAELQNERLMP